MMMIIIIMIIIMVISVPSLKITSPRKDWPTG